MAGCSGRGPTIFMSPCSTLKSWGSSLSRNFRSTRPIGVTRVSSGWAQTCGSRCAEATCIVRNLYIVNGWPPWSSRRRVLPPARDRARRSRPMRVCRNSTGPREVSLMSTAMSSSSGDATTNATPATMVLSSRRNRRSRSRGRPGTRWTLPSLGRAGEIVARPSGWLAERLVQGRQHRGIDALARVTDRELEARRAQRPSGDLDEAGLGELHGIGGEVEQHPPDRARVADTALRDRMDQLDLEPLLFGERQHHPPHRVEDFYDGEGQGPALEQPVAPAGELEDVARGRAQTERCTINEPQLAPLAVGHWPVLRVLQGFRQEQDRGERGAQVVRHLDHELLAIRPTQALRQVLRLGPDLGNPNGRRRVPLELFGGARLHACAPLRLRG